MDEGDWAILLWLIIGLLIFGGVGLGVALSDDDEWIKTEDASCYLHVHGDNRLLADDTVSRTRYCEVGS